MYFALQKAKIDLKKHIQFLSNEYNCMKLLKFEQKSQNMAARYLGFIIFLSLLSASGYSQTKLLLTNGKIIPAKFIAGSDSNIVLNKYKNQSIFSIIYPDDSEQIIFEKSSPEAGKIVLFNGKTIPFRKLKLTDTKIFYLSPSMNKDAPEKKFKKRKADDVYTIKYNDGKEKILYLPDTAFRGEMNIAEMDMFIKGEQDALAFYNKRLPAIGGFASGIGGSYFGFYSVFIPAFYITSLGAKTPKIDKIKELNMPLNKKIQNNEYVAGFEKKAKDKNIMNGSKGALLGLIIGLVSLQILFGK